MNRNCNRFNLLALMLLAICPILLATPPAHAATILVDIDPITGAGVVEVDAADGLCSLKEAIVNANNGAPTHADCTGGTAGANTIVLPTGAMFTLTAPVSAGTLGVAGLPVITSEITIAGNGATIQRDAILICNLNGMLNSGEFRLLVIQSTGNLTIEDLTLANGCADGLGNARFGGGIFNELGTLTLRRSTLRNNSALTAGGGLYESSLSPETGTLIESSTLSDNMASSGGGLRSNGNVTVRNSTLSGNAADLRGGGIAVQGNLLGATSLTLEQVSFFDNTAPDGGGIYAIRSTTNARNVILQGSDCGSQSSSPPSIWNVAGANLDSGTSCADVFGSNFTANAVTGLGSLADNGGPTQTHALLPGSQAVDAVPVGDCTSFDGNTDITTDQRGIARPQGSACDIGAYELVNAMPIADAGTDQSATSGDLVTLDGSGSFDPDGHVPLTYAWLQIVGDSVSLSNAGAAMPTFSAPFVDGDLVFELIVTDSFGLASDPNTVTVTVELPQYEVTAATGNGQGNITPASQTVVWDETATFTVTPDAGWSTAALGADSCTPMLIADDQWQAANIQADCVVQATFEVNQYIIGGTVVGLEGSGLTLELNGSELLPISTSGGFQFSTELDHESNYVVVIGSQPSEPNQTCSINNGSGTVNAQNVDNIAVTCTTNTYTVGGSLSGLAAGNSVILQNNAGDDLALSANGLFTFDTALADQSNFNVTILTPPTAPNQTCTVTSGSGTLAGQNFESIEVACTIDTFTIGGAIAGLEGSGLVLQNNGSDDLVISSDGPFTFTTALDDLSSYNVTIPSQPGTPSQTCTVTNGSGTLAGQAIGNVMVACTTDAYTIGGDTSGLEGSGLVLQNNGGDDLTIGADGPFTFSTALDDLSSYNVTVLSQPDTPSQTCTVINGSGELASENIANVEVACTTNTFTIGGTVASLEGSGLTLTNNGGDDLSISSNGPFTFATALDDLASYEITVATQPGTPSQACSITNGSGTLAGQAVDNVEIACTTNTFIIGGTVVDLEGSGLLLQNNGSDDLLVDSDGLFTFLTALDDLSGYEITVATQPGTPSQACSITNGSGVLAGENIGNVEVTCTTDTFTIGGTVTGLDESGLVLQNNDGDDLVINENGAFTFATALDDLSGYIVTVLDQPSGQLCSINNASGELSGEDIDDLAVECVRIELSLSMSAIEFTGLLANQAGEQTLTLTNSGQAELVIENFIPPGQPFAFDALDCAPLPRTLAPGESCSPLLRFSSATLGQFGDELGIISNAGSSPDRVTLSGSTIPNPIPVPGPGLPALLVLVLGVIWLGTRRPQKTIGRR